MCSSNQPRPSGRQHDRGWEPSDDWRGPSPFTLLPLLLAALLCGGPPSDEDYDAAQAAWDDHRRQAWANDPRRVWGGPMPMLAMCTGDGDDVADQTPPAGRSPQTYGRDWGNRVPKLFARLAAALGLTPGAL